MTTPLPIPDGIYDLRLKYGDVIRNVMVQDGTVRVPIRGYWQFMDAQHAEYVLTPVVVPDTIPEK